MKPAALVLMISMALTACSGRVNQSASSRPNAAPPSTAPSASAPTGLEGTRWRLVEMQSMDDAQGTARPADPAKYTLSFGKDGRVAAQLDCNRGMGSWKGTSGEGGSGTIEIGPLAVTRAMCPPPSLGGKLATSLGYVRTYLRKNNRLHLSLMADGGILVWEPIDDAK